MTFVRRFLPVVVSALVPGLGQAARGRLADGALFLGAAIYLHWVLAGCACRGGGATSWAESAFFVGPAGFPGGFLSPVAVVMGCVTLALHALAAWDARARQVPEDRQDQGAARRSRESAPPLA